MKQISLFGLMAFLFGVVSSHTVSAHGFHAEALEAVEHMRIHLIENSFVFVVTLVAIVAGYAIYRKGKSTQEKE